MSKVNGAVEVVSRSEKGVKINNEWYNSKDPAFKDCRRGDVIEFAFEVGSNGGKFLKGGITKKASGGGASSKPYSKSSGNSNYEVGAAVGMAVNNAVLLSIAEGKGFDESFINDAAIKVYTLAEQMKEKAASGAFKPKENTPEPATNNNNKVIEDESEEPMF
jgi:hypothetical protein